MLLIAMGRVSQMECRIRDKPEWMYQDVCGKIPGT